MISIGDIYADGRRRISDLLAPVTDEQAATPVPCCPGWTVHDVTAHLVGSCADILAGNLEGVATDAWTAAQVESRRGVTLAALLEEWAERASQVEAIAEAFPGRSGQQWIADQITHEHDIRGALGKADGRESAGMDIGLGFFVEVGLHASLTARGLGPLEVHAGGRRWIVGGEDGSAAGGQEPRGALEASAFDLFRSLSGRRSRAQIAAFGWSVEPGPYLDAFGFGPFTLSPVDVEE